MKMFSSLRGIAHTFTPAQRKVVLAACFGTFLEWYDFLTFASLAIYFSVLFFPPDNPTAALLASLATFGVGMLVRPLGAAIFGSLGDKYGRRPIFLATIFLMGITTFLVGLLPTYQQVGMLAPALLLLLRLLQGFAVGGEIGGAAVYLTEHAPNERRGVYTSVLQLMGPLGIMASMLQVVVLQAWLGDDFAVWGWRVPFLLSLVLLLISLKARLSMIESPVFEQLREEQSVSKAPLKECLKDRRTLGRMALLFFCISAGGSLLFFSSQVYTGVYLKSVVKLDPQLTTTLVLISTIALFPLTIYFGALSDRIGRRPVLLAGLLLGALTILPVFSGLLHFGNPALARFNAQVKVELSSNEACHYNPFVAPRNDCERNQQWLVKNGIVYMLAPQAGDSTLISVNAAQQVQGFQPQALAQVLQAAGWPDKADPAEAHPVVIVLLLLVLVVALALITGPQTAVLAELFPARTRYTAAALPHNLSAGWIGGMSPFMVTLIGSRLGDAALGIWYLMILLGITFIVGLLFLPETRNTPLGH